jgi:hypothetical protein
MKLAEFDSLTEAELSPLLSGKENFAFANGAYSRELPNGLRQVVLVDFDTRKRTIFQVIVGFNHVTIAGALPAVEAGVFGVRYLTPGGFSAKACAYPCASTEVAKKSLSVVKAGMQSYVLPWFESHEDLASVAAAIEGHYPFVKGKLFFLAGKVDDARVQLKRHLDYLSKMPKTPETVRGSEETHIMLVACN